MSELPNKTETLAVPNDPWNQNNIPLPSTSAFIPVIKPTCFVPPKNVKPLKPNTRRRGAPRQSLEGVSTAKAKQRAYATSYRFKQKQEREKLTSSIQTLQAEMQIYRNKLDEKDKIIELLKPYYFLYCAQQPTQVNELQPPVAQQVANPNNLY